MMNRMMEETLLTGTARRASIPGWPAAGKTGTSQDYRDAWFIGYTGHMVTGVWLGNDDSSPTKKATGSGLPVDVWDRFMRAAHQNVPVANLPGVNLYPNTGWAQQPQTQAYPGDMLPPNSVGQQQPPPPPRSDNPFTQLFDTLFGRR
jgi:penicillin-binding protein 1A